MNGMIGADPDALERLAGDFDRGAGSLESIVLRVRTSVHANPWAGARATRFRSDWDQRHGPQLKRTATTLRAAATQLRKQAAEQRQASSAGGGVLGRAGDRRASATQRDLLRGLMGDQRLVQNMQAGSVLAFGLLSGIARTHPNSNYGDIMRGINSLTARMGTDNLLRFKKWDLFQDLHTRLSPYKGSFAVGSKWIGRFSAVGSVVSAGLNAETALSSWQAGDGIGGGVAGTNAVADVMSLVPGIGTLGSLALRSGAIVLEESQKVDPSVDVVGYAAQNPMVAVEEVGKATVTVFGTLLGFKK